MIEIRKATYEDLVQIGHIEETCFPTAEAASYESFLHRYQVFPESFFVACDNNNPSTIVGFINGCVTNEQTIRDEMYDNSKLHDPNGAYQAVFGLCVLPTFQKQGIASKLMNILIEDARSKNRKGLILTCKERLIPYYEKFGYVNHGISASIHGNVVWYDMRLDF